MKDYIMKKLLTALALITITATSGCIDSSSDNSEASAAAATQGWDYEKAAADWTCIAHYTCFAISAITPAVPRVPTEEILAIWAAENAAFNKAFDKCFEGDEAFCVQISGPQGLAGHKIIYGTSIFDQ